MRQRGSLSAEGPGLLPFGDNPDPRAWADLGGHFTHELPETPRRDGEKKHRGQGGWAGNGPRDREAMGPIRPAPIPPLRPLGGNANLSGSLPKAPGEGNLTARLSGTLPKEKAAPEGAPSGGSSKGQREEAGLTAEEALLVDGGMGSHGKGVWTL